MAATSKLKPMDFLFVVFTKKTYGSMLSPVDTFEVRIYRPSSKIPENDFIFQFETFTEAETFVSCAISVSLFRNNRTHQKESDADFLIVSKKMYPELFLSELCSLPIRTFLNKRLSSF